MEREEYLKLKKLFLFGIVASLVTVFLGEIPIGWVVNPEADNTILSMILGYASLSLPQLACGMFFGGVGIPLQYCGYKAIAEVISKSACKKYAKLTEIGAKAIAFGGATVHVICVALMYICKMECAGTLSEIPQNIVDFTLWLVLPFSAVFMTIYTIMTIAMAIPIVSGKTIFPKWAVVFNPLAAKVLIPIIAMILPNTKIVNGLNMADMGIGSLITFIGLLILFEKNQKIEV
jgi:hypothetical protein